MTKNTIIKNVIAGLQENQQVIFAIPKKSKQVIEKLRRMKTGQSLVLRQRR